MTITEIEQRLGILMKERNALNQRIWYWSQKIKPNTKPNMKPNTKPNTQPNTPPPPLSPKKKESSKEIKNTPNTPTDTTTTGACACEGENHTTEPKAQSRMKVPTIEECREYHAAKKYSWEIESFYDYYTANGWKVGRNPMRDWRAAMRNWNRTEKNKTSGGTSAGYYRRRADNDQRPTAEQVKDIMEVL